MKELFALLTALALICALTACGGAGTRSNPEQSQSPQGETQSGSGAFSPSQSASSPSTTPDGGEHAADEEKSNVLVAYFSATGNTEGIARHIRAVLNADLYEIVPEVPYSSDDLNYSQSGTE